jgi:hypothetical protein
MSGLRSNMFRIDRICLVIRNFVQQKSKSRDKMMRLCLDKLTISELNNMDIREMTGTTRSKLNSMIQI